MSILRLTLQEFASIASTVKYTPALRDTFLLPEEIGFLTKLKAYPPTPEELDNKINCWTERLYIANYVANDYAENGDNILVKRLTSANLEGTLLHLQELHKTLTSLRYNLYTNSGASFASETDRNKLNYLISFLEKLKTTADTF
jgi:hypothetical protein